MYIQAVTVLVTDNKEDGEKPEEDEPVDDTFEKCHELLNEVISHNSKHILN